MSSPLNFFSSLPMAAEWKVHVLLASLCGALTVWLARKICMWVTGLVADKLEITSSSDKGTDARDKFVGSSWSLCIHTTGLFVLMWFLGTRNELGHIFYGQTSADNVAELWLPFSSFLSIWKPQLWVISLEVGFYLVELFYVIAEPPPDRNEKILHHLAALSLITVSVYVGHQQIGIYIMIIHKIIEPFLFGAKAVHYAGEELMSSVLFALFVLIWLPTRLYVYPVWITKILWAPGIQFHNDQTFYLTAAFLGALLTLHIYWTALIFKAVYVMISEKKLKSELDPSYKETRKVD